MGENREMGDKIRYTIEIDAPRTARDSDLNTLKLQLIELLRLEKNNNVDIINDMLNRIITTAGNLKYIKI